MYNIMAPLLYYGAVHVYGEGSVNMDILLAEQKCIWDLIREVSSKWKLLITIYSHPLSNF